MFILSVCLAAELTFACLLYMRVLGFQALPMIVDAHTRCCGSRPLRPKVEPGDSLMYKASIAVHRHTGRFCNSRIIRQPRMQSHSLISFLIFSCSFYPVSFTASVQSASIGTITNHTISQALNPIPSNGSTLTEEDEWPLKDGYWLQLDTANDLYLPEKNIMAVLPRAEKTLGKKPHNDKITGIAEFGPDGTDPHNEAVFVIMPAFGNELTWGDAVNVVVGLIEWYRARQLYVTTYFWLKDQATGRGEIGYGAMKRRWQPFPPDYNANISIS